MLAPAYSSAKRFDPRSLPDIPPPGGLRPCCAFGVDLHVKLQGLPVPGTIGNIDGPEDLDRTATARTRVTGPDPPQVAPLIDGDVARHVDTSQVHVVAIGASHHVVPAPQHLVGDDADGATDSDGAEAPRRGAERADDLVLLGG